MTSTVVSDDKTQCSFTSCKKFGKQLSRKAFQNHKYQYHNESYYFNYTDPQGNAKCVNIDRVNDVLTCKFCHKKYKLADTFRKHIFNASLISARAILEGNKSDDDSISEDDDAAHVTLDIMTTISSTQEKEEENNARHDYKTAVLSAFNALNKPDREQEKKFNNGGVRGTKANSMY
ncbi:hypothetical protein G6F57_003524 [Rhizopus arrhizus]|nr:hypothetical protein G6F22_008096 [Rhizopus arrhizus]KAG1418342.1 hypothetical protein G6F58_005109 [Rhizopus delemar]KAG0815731.1 hypothetical protein G6F20_003767 [Rhizopus arrhizus]KAG0874003.1 hypothetical protein G6F16_004069 [Rhizopus arrhizus]KAG0899692.1 hypothetical protein G6F34_004510 [Rhizopus arrhizus]